MVLCAKLPKNALNSVSPQAPSSRSSANSARTTYLLQPPSFSKQNFKIVFEDIIVGFLARQRNKPYSSLLSMCLNEDRKEDFGKQMDIVKALKQNHRDLEDLEKICDGSSGGVSVCWR
jgi:hypothetical protein